MILKEKKNFRKMFIVTEYAALTDTQMTQFAFSQVCIVWEIIILVDGY